MKMVCGHNICRTCLMKYSATEHPKSSVRCEICNIETKVLMMSVSIPNRALCQILAEVEQGLGRKLYSGNASAMMKAQLLDETKQGLL